jgi:hypothetical protein
MQINKIAVLIVLYNKKIKDSATIKSVLEIGNKQNLSLSIVNNGPEKIEDFSEFKNKNSDFDSIEFHEFLENKSLSKIYNNLSMIIQMQITTSSSMMTQFLNQI